MSGRGAGAAAVKCFLADFVGGIGSLDEPERVWVQGVAVASGGLSGGALERGFVLDDGTGLLPIDARKLPPLAPSSSSPSSPPSSMPCPVGAYVMVIGSVARREDGARVVVAAKLVDLSPDPNRESMWYLEVLDCAQHLARQQ